MPLQSPLGNAILGYNLSGGAATMSKKAEPLSKEQKRLNILLLTLAILALLNLLMTASIVGLVGTLLILVMVWGIRRGDYPLATALAVFLFLYAIINLVVLGVVIFSGTQAPISSLLWLSLYSVCLLVLGALLRTKSLREYLKTAKPPAEKPKRFHFFHGGWRDL